jgi:hypothetical protein
MRRRAILVAVALCCFASAKSDAGYLSADGLAFWCESLSSTSKNVDEHQVDKAIQCLAYVNAVADALDGTAFCLPPKPDATRLVDIVNAYLDERPDLKDPKEPGSSVVIAALKEKFPCN